MLSCRYLQRLITRDKKEKFMLLNYLIIKIVKSQSIYCILSEVLCSCHNVNYYSSVDFFLKSRFTTSVATCEQDVLIKLISK